MTLTLNSILEKRYRVEKKLGQGGLDATYQVWLFQGRLIRFEVHGVIAENLVKTAYFGLLREVKAENS